MAAPITWRNVNAPGIGGAEAALIQSGGQQIQQSIAGLQNILGAARQTQDNNLAAVNTRNTDLLMEKVRQTNTLEGQQQLQGQLPGLLNGLGQGVDRKGIWEALNRRDNEIMQDETDQHNFGEMQVTREQAPIVRQIGQLTAAGRYDEANALLKQNPELRSIVELQQGIKSGRRDDWRFGNEQAQAGRAAQSHALQMNQARLAQQEMETARKMEGILVSAAKESNGDQGLARKLVEQKLDQAGIPKGYLDDAFQGVDSKFNIFNAPTNAERNAATSLFDQQQLANDQYMRNNPLNQQFAFGDGLSAEEAIAAGRKNAETYDNQDEYDTDIEAALPILRKEWAAMAPADIENKALPGRLIELALAETRMDNDYSWNDFDEKAFKVKMRELMKGYVSYSDSRRVIEANERSLLKLRAAAGKDK